MSADEVAIRDVIATWLSASRRGDVETVLGLMDDDVVFLVAGQPDMRGKAAFAAASSAQAQQKPWSIDGASEVVELTVIGEYAYVWTRLTVTVVPQAGAPPITRKGNTLSIFRRRDGRWLLYRDANLLAVAKD